MKKFISVILILIIFLVGCQSVADQNDTSSQSSENITTTSDSGGKTATDDPMPSQSIEIHSLEQLNEMRAMASCNDETQLEQYIQSAANSGIKSREDLVAFVKIIDSLPNIPVLEGNITWIRFSSSISEDTGKETNVVYITTEATNGDWTRVEYVLSVGDVSKKISDEKISIAEASVLTSPVKSSDGNLTLHTETRAPHSSGNGTLIQWIGEADGIFTRIYYFTNSAADVETQNLFGNMQIATMSK